MIFIKSWLSASLVAVALFGSPEGAQEHALRPGLYEIEVTVERGASQQQPIVVKRCFEPEAIASHTIFEVLSDESISTCPKYEICAGPNRTGFMAHCTGTRPASAVGMFALERNSFRGRIEFDRDTANPPSSEVQYGRRIGECGVGIQ